MKKNLIIVLLTSLLSSTILVPVFASEPILEDETQVFEEDILLDETEFVVSNNLEEQCVEEDGDKSNNFVIQNEVLDENKSLAVVASGTHGDDVYWTLTEDGTLTISGTGGMDTLFSAPWKQYKEQIIHVNIQYGITDILMCSFEGCENLTTVEIPSSVTSIEWAAFDNCSGLESIKVDSDNPTYDSRNNCNAIIVKSAEGWGSQYVGELIKGCKNTVIPNGVIGIGYGAFEGCTDLTHIDIPESVEIIDTAAFMGCENLTSIVIPNGIWSIYAYAFKNCKRLTSIEFPRQLVTLWPDVIEGCIGLKKVRNNSSKSVNLPSVDGKYWKNKETGETITSISEGTAIRSDYAYEDPDIYTVTFDPNGGSFAAGGFDGIYHGIVENTKIPTPIDNPTRSGYTFDGWYKESSCKNKWNFANDTVENDMTLYAKWNKISAPKPDVEAVEYASQTIAKGGKLTINDFAKAQSITYTKANIAEIDKTSGTIKGIATGETTAKVKMSDSKEYTAKINVVEPKFKAGKLYPNKGKTVKTNFDKKGISSAVTYKSNNTKVATVDKNGKVTAKKVGKATITATVQGKKYTCTVTVCNPTISGKASVQKGKSTTLTIKNGNGTTKWKSSNTKIATVDKNGKVKGKKKGKVTITAVNNGKTIKKTITVK